MSEVKRYHLGDTGLVEGQALGRLNVVLAADFDNVTRLFLDAVERAVASERREKELQQRLTAADERADVLEGLLREASVELHDFITGPLLDRIDATLKPAEGGGAAHTSQ